MSTDREDWLWGIPLRHGAYWLHPDGWYRLIPPPYDWQALSAFDPQI